MDINFEWYKIFYHTTKAGSFSEAARQLFITQSAVSQAIANLEEKLGSRLFIRKARCIKLTHEGEVLLKHVEQAYHFLKAGEGKLQEIQCLDLGEIRIGVGDTVCRYFLVPYLQDFVRTYPKVKVRVINRTSPRIIETLKSGQIDLGIVTLPMADESVAIRPFKAVEDIFVASDKFGELRNVLIPAAELVRYPLLLLDRHSATRRSLDTFFRERNLTINPEIELESMELLAEFARIGLGVAHVLKKSVCSLIDCGDLFPVQLLEDLPRRQLGIATVKAVPLSPASARFIELLSAN